MDGIERGRTFFVKAEWDGEAGVWYTSQTDIPGLVAEAETPEELVKLLNDLIPELVELNGVEGDSIPYSLTLDHLVASRTIAAA